MTLFQHPDQLAELKTNPSLAPAFVEELCRFHTGSALALKRTATVDVEIGGQVRPHRRLHVDCLQDTDQSLAYQGR